MGTGSRLDIEETKKRLVHIVCVEDGYCEERLMRHGVVMDDWSSCRRRCAHVMYHPLLDIFMAIIVLINIAVIVGETNENAGCSNYSCDAGLFSDLNLAILIVYLVEVSVRIFVLRRQALFNYWVLLQLVIVITGAVDAGLTIAATKFDLQDGRPLKIVRMFKLLLALRFIEFFPALRGLMRGFSHAVVVMFWGVLAVLSLHLAISVLAVELAFPVARRIDFGGNDWCKDAFSRVHLSMFFLFQTTVAGDSFGACTIPLGREEPLLFILFALTYIAVQLGLTNLILAAIIDEANQAHENDTEARNEELLEMEREHIKLLAPIFIEMDSTGSGEFTEEELLAAYDSHQEVRKIFKLLNVTRKSLSHLFHMMDVDGSGTVGIDEFLDVMRDGRLQDSRMQFMSLKLQVAGMHRALENGAVLPSGETIAERRKRTVSRIQTEKGAENEPPLNSRASGIVPSELPMSERVPLVSSRRSIEEMLDSIEVGVARARELLRSESLRANEASRPPAVRGRPGSTCTLDVEPDVSPGELLRREKEGSGAKKRKAKH